MDIVKQMMEGTAAVLAKVLLKKTENKEFFIEQHALEPADVIILINALLSEGRYGDAEDTLFSQFELAPSLALYEAGIAMYERLSALPDSDLDANNFPRVEVVRGLSDFQSLRQGQALF